MSQLVLVLGCRRAAASASSKASTPGHSQHTGTSMATLTTTLMATSRGWVVVTVNEAVRAE